MSPARLAFRHASAFLLALVLMGTAAAQERLGVNLADKPDPVALSAFNVCIIRDDARLDLEGLHAVGTKVLGTIDLREVSVASEAAKEAQGLGVPLRESGAAGVARLDVTHPGWVTVVARVLVRAAAERGFDGFVLTGLGSLAGEAERAAALEMLAVLRGMYPEKTLILKDAPSLSDEAGRHLDGVFITSGQNVEPRVREAVRQGLKAYVVETGTKPEQIQERAQAIEALGGVAFFTTPSLDGVNLGPLREVTRRIVILHSGKARDSFAAAVLHGSLQWLGYEVLYCEFT
ncbi:MAG TPA: hypothetical protein VD994_12655, partial [Prosthecobacter sp.]|nr:hypothetical protein [Prosthecobacter sp.]